MSHTQDRANQYVLSSKWADLQHQSLKIHTTVNDTVNLTETDQILTYLSKSMTVSKTTLWYGINAGHREQ